MTTLRSTHARKRKKLVGEPDPVKEMQPILEESAATSQEEGKMTSQSVTRGAPEEYNVFIGQVPFECTAEELQEVFRQQGIENIVLRLHKGRRARGTAFGVCSSKKDFDLALSVHGKGFQGRRLVVEKAKSARQARKDTDEQYTPRRVFMGQLPYQATVADIQKHMTSLGVGQLKIRLLTDRRTKKSRGIAFADCKDDKQLVRALRAHHTSLLGKVINVERTVGGGGKGDRRKAKIQRLRERQGAKVHKDTKKIVASVISQSESCPVTLEDIDDRAIEALGTFPRQVVEALLREYVAIDFEAVKSKSAYLMGAIKRYRSKLEEGTDFFPEQSTWEAMNNRKTKKKKRQQHP